MGGPPAWEPRHLRVDRYRRAATYVADGWSPSSERFCASGRDRTRLTSRLLEREGPRLTAGAFSLDSPRMKTPEPPPLPRRYTSPTGRIVIPVLLVVLLIVVLGRPILVSGLNLDDDPEPVPTEDGNGRNGNGRGPSRLASQYPKACFAGDAHSGVGLIAAAAGGSVTVRSPGGSQAFALRAEPPIGWSASGKFLATAGADVWTERGNRIGIAFSRPVDKWAWSPTGDCLVGIEGNRLSVVQPDRRAVALVKGMRITSFAFSPDGTRIAFAVEEGRDVGIWTADLQSGDVQRLQSSVGWTLQAWTRAERPLLLRFAEEGRGNSDLFAFPPSDQVTYCGDTVITIEDGQLAEFGESGTPAFIAEDRRFVFSAVSCAPSGELLVTVRQHREGAATELVAMRRTGRVVDDQLGRMTVRQDRPDWGPSGTGVVFAATVRGEGTPSPLVWFIPEGGTARTTGLRVDRLGDDLDARLDWSATPPLGHPT